VERGAIRAAGDADSLAPSVQRGAESFEPLAGPPLKQYLESREPNIGATKAQKELR
jgi:hypothetical protein